MSNGKEEKVKLVVEVPKDFYEQLVDQAEYYGSLVYSVIINGKKIGNNEAISRFDLREKVVDYEDAEYMDYNMLYSFILHEIDNAEAL